MGWVATNGKIEKKSCPKKIINKINWERTKGPTCINEDQKGEINEHNVHSNTKNNNNNKLNKCMYVPQFIDMTYLVLCCGAA